MTKRMLIDATHAEETRVAIADNDFLVEFDYESKLRKQLKGSIFLAKVTRVEPSLQAAFVNFGGNRHGFLPFSEIHPDYFRIPVADREALIEAQKAEIEARDRAFAEEEEEGDLEEETEEELVSAEEEEEEEDVVEVGGADKPADDDDDEGEEEEPEEDTGEEEAEDVFAEEADDIDGNVAEDDAQEEIDTEEEASVEAEAETDAEEGADEEKQDKRSSRRGRSRGRRGRSSAARSRRSEKYGDEGDEEGRPFRFDLRRHYKIQEVIKRGQIVLVQASKEERGNKGAAVTTYLSLPGRYCVLMPNSPRGGGVSRKIASYQERKRLKKVLAELEIPEGMSVILRTAGIGRTKAEIKRDLDYLMRLWNTIREETLQSTAPSLIYEEGNLIKRSIRDLYDKDIEEVLVAGEEGVKNAKAFMKMLMPSHVKKVKDYKDEKIPLFHKYKIENQISDIGKTNVTLKSGGYLVINPTEALVSVDVNSGRATKERHIEETALKTNLEAAEEVARQMRLRDLGGLVVIDFIDMEDRRNNRKVENKVRQALSQDRARIQVGRISSFGLMELSRQRLNPSLTEMQFEPCPECGGLGRVPTLDFAAVKVMRALVEEGIKGNAAELSLTVPAKISFYLLNQKRDMMSELESRYEMKVFVRAEDEMAVSDYRIEVQKKRSKNDNRADVEEVEDQVSEEDQETVSEEGEKKQSRSSRRRGRRGGRNRRARNAKPDQQSEGQDKVEDQSGDFQKEEVKEKSKKPVKKAAKKSSGEKEPQAEKEVPPPSNDTKPEPKDYEKVNEPPKQKKKGWWNKFTGE